MCFFNFIYKLSIHFVHILLGSDNWLIRLAMAVIWEHYGMCDAMIILQDSIIYELPWTTFCAFLFKYFHVIQSIYQLKRLVICYRWEILREGLSVKFSYQVFVCLVTKLTTLKLYGMFFYGNNNYPICFYMLILANKVAEKLKED